VNEQDKDFIVGLSENPEVKKLANEGRALYQREYRMRNKERVDQISTRYWAKKALKQKATQNQDITDNSGGKTFGQLYGKEYKELLEFLARTNENARQQLAVLNDMIEKGEIEL